MVTKNYLITVRETSHSRHNAENVVVSGVDADLSGVVITDGVGGKDKLKGGVIDSGEVAGSRRLVLLRAKCEGVDVDTSVRGTGVVLVRLNEVEVGTLALREAVLSVKLKLGGDNGVLSPAVHLECGLGKNERTGVRDKTAIVGGGGC